MCRKRVLAPAPIRPMRSGLAMSVSLLSILRVPVHRAHGSADRYNDENRGPDLGSPWSRRMAHKASVPTAPPIKAPVKETGPVTVPEFRSAKAQGRRLVMLTAYDYTMARLVDAAGVDAILVGDS